MRFGTALTRQPFDKGFPSHILNYMSVFYAETLKCAEQTAAQAGVSLSTYIESRLWAHVRCAGAVILALGKFCLMRVLLNTGGFAEAVVIIPLQMCDR